MQWHHTTETPEVGGHVPPQVLGYQLTLFGPRGADYARHITTCPPIFSDGAASLLSCFKNDKKKVKYLLELRRVGQAIFSHQNKQK